MTPPASQTKAAPNPPPAYCGFSALQNLSLAAQTYFSGISAYATDFFVPYLISTSYFRKVESEKLLKSLPMETFNSYMRLLDFNLDLVNKSFASALDTIGNFSQNEIEQFLPALIKSISKEDSSALDEYARNNLDLVNNVVYGYPQAIEDIESEFGFHFERGDHKLIDETDRFYLYQVAPSKKGLTIRPDAKPVLIIPPYVLGANILCFLPGEQRSYVHCFANKGFPTYIRILKKIEDTEALQVMTAEDDAKDTQKFCQTIFKRHDKPVTLNGYCQGGFNALCDLLSGELDELVDAFITCVAPMDGTRSQGLADFLKRLPKRFNNLDYGTKTLPNGNKVADGRLMGWVYRLKSISTEQPLAAFFNNMALISSTAKNDFKFSKVAAALNHWLLHERSDLPLEITKISFASYNTPITKDGVLPVKLFGRKLELKRLSEKKIPWLICYGVHDNLVEAQTALAPLDHIDAEVSPFPKGHVAIATSWSSPSSACALDTRFGEGNWRGPVRFHMDLDEGVDMKKSKTKTGAAITATSTSAIVKDKEENTGAKEISMDKKSPQTSGKPPEPDEKVAPKTTQASAAKTAQKTETSPSTAIKQKKSSRKKSTTTAAQPFDEKEKKPAKKKSKAKSLKTKATKKSQTNKTLDAKSSKGSTGKSTPFKGSGRTVKT